MTNESAVMAFRVAAQIVGVRVEQGDADKLSEALDQQDVAQKALLDRLDALEQVAAKARDVVRSRRVDWQPIQRDWAGLEKALSSLDGASE